MNTQYNQIMQKKRNQNNGASRDQKSGISGLHGGNWQGTLDCILDGLDDKQKSYLRDCILDGNNESPPPRASRGQRGGSQGRNSPNVPERFHGGGAVNTALRHYHKNRELLMGTSTVETWAALHYQHSKFRPVFKAWRQYSQPPANPGYVGLRRHLIKWQGLAKRMRMIEKITISVEDRFALQLQELQSSRATPASDNSGPQLAQSQKQLAQLESQMAQLSSQLSNLEAELRQVKAEKRDVEAEKRQLEIELRELRNKAGGDSKATDNLKAKLTQMTQERDRLKEELARAQKGSKDGASLEEELKQARLEKRNAVADKKALEEQLRAQAGLKDQVRELEQELRSLRNQPKEDNTGPLKARIKQLEDELSAMRRAKSTAEEEARKAKALQDKLRDLESQLKSERSKPAPDNGLKAKVKALEGECDVLDEENESLRKQLKMLESEVENLKALVIEECDF